MMSMYYIYNKIKQAILITHYRPQLCRNFTIIIVIITIIIILDLEVTF